jgi:hypothetical protein
MAPEPMPEREVLEDDSDVSAISTRRLVLRAVNSTLRLEHAVGKLTAEVSACRSDILALKAQDGGFRKELDSVPDLLSSAAHAEIEKLERRLEEQRRDAAEALLEEKLAAAQAALASGAEAARKESERQQANRDARRNGYLIAIVTVAIGIAGTYATEELRHQSHQDHQETHP